MKAKHLVWIRRISQGLFLALFLILLFQSRLPQDAFVRYSLVFSSEEALSIKWPVEFFFQLDPLVALTSWISGHILVEGIGWAILLLLTTIFLGRIFCGFICPFGTIHHLASSIRPALKGKRLEDSNQKSKWQQAKYFVLIMVLIGGFFGLNLAGIMDPISFLFRSMAISVLPAIGIVASSIFHAFAFSDIKLIAYLSYGGEFLVAPLFGYEPQAFQTGWFIGILFLFILFLNRLKPRFWCRALCPLGALLGLFSRFSLLRLSKDEAKCTHCGICTRVCQGAASPEPQTVWEPAECITCFNCFYSCPEDALSFKLKWTIKPNKAPDMGRRAVLGGLLAGVSIPFLGRLDGKISKVPDSSLIRPPGAVPEEKFLTLCQRCGLCMKVCPTNAIHPTLGEAGAAGLWTPKLIMNIGYCEYTCTLCGNVCPTGAIEELSIKEKIGKPVRIGSAFIERGKCLPWSGNAPCIVCEEHCPTSPKAIYLRKEKVKVHKGKVVEMQLPFVELSLCVGCGICQNKCPVKGEPAIRVISAGESRSQKTQLLL